MLHRITGALAWIALGLALSIVDSSARALAAANSVQIVKRKAQALGFPADPKDAAVPRINRPFFDQAGQLQWSDALVHKIASGSCDTLPPKKNPNGYPIHPRQTKLLAPRVDERSCSREGQATEIALIGVDSSGRKIWERQTAFQSGSHRIDQRLIGAAPDGLVLSSLEVWSPKTGATIVPAATRAIAAESRAVPARTYWGAALYHQPRKMFYVFESDVKLLSRQGGLYEINAADGMKTLIHPVVTTLLGGYDAIEAMALLPDGRHLALAQRLSWRGPTDVSFAILDLHTSRLLFHERFCRRSQETCANPQVVAGPKGALAFSYANLNRREHQLLLYELKQ